MKNKKIKGFIFIGIIALVIIAGITYKIYKEKEIKLFF